MQNSYSAARSTAYGEFASASGYGYSRYVDCNSALALLGFVLFVDILRDILENITKEKAMKRKKRWTPGSGGEGELDSDILAFVSEDGAQHLYHNLPEILAPALEGWWKLSGEEHPKQCLQQSVCQANFVLARDYGVTGRIIATLFSNVVSHAFPGSEGEMLDAALSAAKSGRRRNVCEETYPDCPGLPISFQQQRYWNEAYNTTSYIQDMPLYHQRKPDKPMSDVNEMPSNVPSNYV